MEPVSGHYFTRSILERSFLGGCCHKGVVCFCFFILNSKPTVLYSRPTVSAVSSRVFVDYMIAFFIHLAAGLIGVTFPTVICAAYICVMFYSSTVSLTFKIYLHCRLEIMDSGKLRALTNFVSKLPHYTGHLKFC